MNRPNDTEAAKDPCSTANTDFPAEFAAVLIAERLTRKLWRIKTAERRRWAATGVAACTWLYLAAVLAVWLLLRCAGDRWWFATVMLFGPRWLYAVPWPVFAVALWTRPRLLWPLAAAAIVLFGPIMGLCLPWAKLVGGDGPTVRVLTCNIDGSAVDVDRLAALVDLTRPDLVALQECPSDVSLIWPQGWHVCRAGELLIASPYLLQNKELLHNCHPPSAWPPVNGLRCSVAMPRGPVGFCCIQLHTPRKGLSEVLDRHTLVNPARTATLTGELANRRNEAMDLATSLQSRSGPWIAAGDFNMPDDSVIYRVSWTGCHNAFSDAGFGFGYTKWTPVRGWCYGLRIDHVLTGAGLEARRCWVGPDVGSDHLPLLADVALPAQ